MFIDALQQVRGQHIGLHKLIPAAIETKGRLSGYPASLRRGFPCVPESVVLPCPITQALPPGPGKRRTSMFRLVRDSMEKTSIEQSSQCLWINAL